MCLAVATGIEAKFVEADINSNAEIEAGGTHERRHAVEVVTWIGFGVADHDQLAAPAQQLDGRQVFNVAAIGEVDVAVGLIGSHGDFTQKDFWPHTPAETIAEGVLLLDQQAADLDRIARLDVEFVVFRIPVLAHFAVLVTDDAYDL